MELLVFGHTGKRTLVFPTRDGRFWEYETLGLVETLRPAIEAGKLQLFCLDGVAFDTLYNKTITPQERIKRHIQFEKYVLEEVLPWTESLNPNPEVTLHGCSLGAYHAVNTALRHPELFCRVVALSGRYDLTWAVAHYADLFDGLRNADIYFHTPTHFLPNLKDPAILAHIRRLEFVLAIGQQDPLSDNTRYLHEVLLSKGARSRLEIWDGDAHRARAWRMMVPKYLA